jgi:hypothetical protein
MIVEKFFYVFEVFILLSIHQRERQKKKENKKGIFFYQSYFF